MLTPDDIRRLATRGETDTIEFKGEARELLSDQDLVEAVVCLANGRGGTILLGVEDDGRITGARPRHGATTEPHRVQALLSNSTVPSVAAPAYLVAVDAHEVLVVEVPIATLPVATSRGRYVRRAIGGDGRPMCTPFFVGQSIGAGMAADPSAVVVPGATWADLDPVEIARWRRMIDENPARADRSLAELSDVDITKALGIVEANGNVRALRRAALLLFGREAALRAHLPTHEVAWQVLRGTELAVNEFFRWPLLRLFEEFLGRFRARNSGTEVFADGVRVEVPDMAEDGFREAFANALIHRDYTVLGAIHVQLREDAVRIDSPGGFPEGVRADNVIDAPPRPRNHLLADAFKRVGLVERTGRGVDVIFSSQLRYGRRPPSYALSTATSVTVELPRSVADPSVTVAVARRLRDGTPLSTLELRVLGALHDGPQPVVDLERRLGTDPTVALHSLVDTRLVGLSGSGSATRAALATTDVAVAGVDADDLSRKVVGVLRKRKRITRAEVAEMYAVSLDQASRILRKLAQEHRNIRSVGRGRGAHYEWKA